MSPIQTLICVVLLATVQSFASTQLAAGGEEAICQINDGHLRCWSAEGELALLPDTGDLEHGLLAASAHVFCARDAHGAHCWSPQRPEIDFHPELAAASLIKVSDAAVCGKIDESWVCFPHAFGGREENAFYPVDYFKSPMDSLFPIGKQLCASFNEENQTQVFKCAASLAPETREANEWSVKKTSRAYVSTMTLLEFYERSNARFSNTEGYHRTKKTFREVSNRIPLQEAGRDTFRVTLATGWDNRVCYVTEQAVNLRGAVFPGCCEGTFSLGGYRPFVECANLLPGGRVSLIGANAPRTALGHPYSLYASYQYFESQFYALVPLKNYICAVGDAVWCGSPGGVLSEVPYGTVPFGDSLCRSQSTGNPSCYSVDKKREYQIENKPLHSPHWFSLTSRRQSRFTLMRMADAVYPWKAAPLRALSQVLDSIGDGLPDQRPEILRQRRALLEAAGRFAGANSAPFFRERVAAEWKRFTAVHPLASSSSVVLSQWTSPLLATAFEAFASSVPPDAAKMLRRFGQELRSGAAPTAALKTQVLELVSAHRGDLNRDLGAMIEYLLE